jgi:hypothetical protein
MPPICTRRGRRRNATHTAGEDAEPLYDTMDALDSLDRFGRVATYTTSRSSCADGVRATFHDAGHILGSASILLDLTEDGVSRRVLFSGDIGPRERPFLHPPSPPPSADIVVMESTYGDRDHRTLGDSVSEFWEAIADAHDRGGNVIIPTFALERAQELLFYLREGAAAGHIDSRVRVFLDSPMAISATQIYRRHAEAMRPDIGDMLRAGKDPFKLPGLQFTRDAADSMALNRIRGGAVIMAGSGMCTGGRVRHHLRHSPSCRLQRDLRGLRRRGNAGADHHRRGPVGEAFRRRGARARAHPHDQRLFGPCRADRSTRLAPPRRVPGAHLPRAWRGCLGRGACRRTEEDRQRRPAPHFARGGRLGVKGSVRVSPACGGTAAERTGRRPG